MVLTWRCNASTNRTIEGESGIILDDDDATDDDDDDDKWLDVTLANKIAAL